MAAVPEPALTVAAVAQRLGLAPGTLRTWDRRYGVGPTGHASGAHRRYSATDVARLERMRRLILEGVTPAEAARHVTGTEPAAAAAEPAQFPDVHGRLPPRHGGRVLPLPGADDLVRGLGRAAMALDPAAVRAIVGEQLEQHGTLRTWDQVLVPVLVAVGERWEASRRGVEVEHLLSDCIATALSSYCPAVEPGPRAPVLACAPDDLHTLPMLALAAALAERGVGARVLGGALPAQALADGLARSRPAVLFLWSQTPDTGSLAVLDAVPVTRPAVTTVLGGPGWPAELPAASVRADSLSAALTLVGQGLTGQALASSG
jgi:DNA-binding transcriptional MerR regulator